MIGHECTASGGNISINITPAPRWPGDHHCEVSWLETPARANTIQYLVFTGHIPASCLVREVVSLAWNQFFSCSQHLYVGRLSRLVLKFWGIDQNIRGPHLLKTHQCRRFESIIYIYMCLYMSCACIYIYMYMSCICVCICICVFTENDLDPWVSGSLACWMPVQCHFCWFQH